MGGGVGRGGGTVDREACGVVQEAERAACRSGRVVSTEFAAGEAGGAEKVPEVAQAARLYRGGDYWLARLPGDKDMRIRNNVDLDWLPGDPEDERFAYPQHAAHALLLEVESDDLDTLGRLAHIPALKRLSP